MTKTMIAKKIVKTVVGTSTSFAVANIVRNNVTPNSTLQKVEAGVASVALGMFVADKLESWTDGKIDETIAAFKSLKG